MPEASTIHVAIARLPHCPALPEYQSDGASGVDLRAATSVTLAAGMTTLIPTGITVAIPQGYEGQVRMRSGLALRHTLFLPNSPGTIDSDYRGEIKVLIGNWGQHPCTLEAGERIAQLVFAPIARAVWQEVDQLDETTRGAGGFGSTGRQ